MNTEIIECKKDTVTIYFLNKPRYEWFKSVTREYFCEEDITMSDENDYIRCSSDAFKKHYQKMLQ